MEAIILAGGLGTRLKAILPNLPKPMAPIAGRPFLEILLHHLARKGFTRVVLSVGHMASTVINHFGESFAGLQLIYEVEESALGTGGAIQASLSHCLGDCVFVFNGDTFFDFNVESVSLCWFKRHNPIIVARLVDDVSRYGSLCVDDPSLVKFIEKGRIGPGLINAGCYLLPKDFFLSSHFSPPFSFETDSLPFYLSQNPIDVVKCDGLFIDIGIPDDYRRAQSLLPKC